MNKSTGALFAVKVISVRFSVQATREAQILSICQEHKNVVKVENEADFLRYEHVLGIF